MAPEYDEREQTTAASPLKEISSLLLAGVDARRSIFIQLLTSKDSVSEGVVARKGSFLAGIYCVEGAVL